MGVKQDHPSDGGKWGAYMHGGEVLVGKYDTRGEALAALEPQPEPKKPAKKPAAKKKG